MTPMDLAQYVLAFLVGTLAIARITRLVYFDSFPPMQWLRGRWDRLTGVPDPEWDAEANGPEPRRRQWNKLMYCPYCVAPYVAAPLLIWGVATDFQAAWWVFCVFVAASYVAALIPASDWG